MPIFGRLLVTECCLYIDSENVKPNHLYCGHIYFVIVLVVGLDPALQPHLPQFQAHCIQGSDIIKMDRQKLEYLKVCVCFKEL